MDYSHLTVSIDTERSDNAVLIRPRIDNPVPLTLGYRMTIRQDSGGNTSSINQQGQLQTGQASSSVRLGLVADGGSCSVHLEVFADQTLITAIDRDCAVR
ncbi:curli-like amyloid fiber formation chaperone CsgH [Pseudomonas monteilii]|uniref:curli-like amyloid fiber formation chaperone CsgH n=1 Tax=Pseudomonas alabamensis TaxID=3064349 RepID=UPI00271232E9|nr:curli-like amyloid fiber formation chaperone CsgH [Pseudomonas sp. 22-AL-CL-001]MDO7912485.1 curli-like amyloid fiber formation chaperone CsgH [Pseudomonas sp. 22-AL-CL-001]